MTNKKIWAATLFSTLLLTMTISSPVKAAELQTSTTVDRSQITLPLSEETEENLYEITKQVGADVPFCIHDKWARVKGIGEKIMPIDSDWKFDVVVVKPEFGISTANAFSKWKESRPFHPDVDLVESSIREKNMDLLYQTMANALEPIAFEIEPELNQVKMDMEDAGLVRILMSGSGSSMLGFSVDEDVISSAYEQLKEKYDFVEIVHVGG